MSFHGVTYAREQGFDCTFEAYVAGPLADFVRRASPRERIWLAERGGELVACIAIVASDERTAQLRWFLVDAAARGTGLGTRLLNDAVAFCEECRYQSVVLWTVSALAAAARLYRRAGFEKVEEQPCRLWGVEVVEEEYELVLPARPPQSS